MTTLTAKLDHVIARNLSELLAERGWRHSDLALAMTASGWTSNTVAQTVTLRRTVGLLELANLCDVFGVPLERFLDGDDDVALGLSGERVDLASVREVLATGSWTKRAGRRGFGSFVPVYTDEEIKVARRVGIKPHQLQTLVGQLYGHTNGIAAERDDRAGDLSGVPQRTAQARRGHAMRAVIAEIEAALEPGRRQTKATTSRKG